MKEYKQEHTEIVRLSFGSKKSISFQDTSVAEVYDLALKVFSEMTVTRTIELEASPLDKPMEKLSLIMTIRHESGAYKLRGYKGKSKSKTLFGLTVEEAYDYFHKHYKRYL